MSKHFSAIGVRRLPEKRILEALFVRKTMVSDTLYTGSDTVMPG
jgi:hypothetical protein